jgi:hypothetical protein
MEKAAKYTTDYDECKVTISCLHHSSAARNSEEGNSVPVRRLECKYRE